MTTWTQHVRHPWYNPFLKRRLSPSDDDDDDSNGVSHSTVSPSHRKRIRYNSLEHTLAHMTLGGATSEDVDMWPKISPPRPRAQESVNVVLPSSVEEPVAEPVDMDVEPTVVMTDAGQLDIREVQISSAALECIKRQTRCLRPLIPLPRQANQASRALVLYRAPPPPSPEPAILVAQEEDVMEVE